MQATHDWRGPIERMPTSKRELSFTLIRGVIVVVLVGVAARLVATAYAPQWFAMSQQLTCPPDVVTYREAVVSPPVLSVADQSATSVTSDTGLAAKSDLRPLVAKEEEHRSGPKKPPNYVFARNGVSQKRAAMAEPPKRGGSAANHQQKSRASAPTLANSGISPSPFGDMRGQ